MYSPKIKEQFIPLLYKAKKERGVTMTSLVNEIISDFLRKEAYLNRFEEELQQKAPHSYHYAGQE